MHTNTEKLFDMMASGDARVGDAIVGVPRLRLPSDIVAAAAQRRALRDICPHADQTLIDGAANFTRSSMILFEGKCAEARPPRVESKPLDDFLKGMREFFVARPRIADGDRLREAATEGMEDALDGVRCRRLDLYRYWLPGWLWRKLHRREKFLEAFAPREQASGGVGAVADWWMRAGIDIGSGYSPGGTSRSWYPARLLVDSGFVRRHPKPETQADA